MDVIHPAPEDFTPEELACTPILRYFHYAHLPPTLKPTSRAFCELAKFMVRTLPSSAERTAGLRKLLEAKDCAVRSLV